MLITYNALWYELGIYYLIQVSQQSHKVGTCVPAFHVGPRLSGIEEIKIQTE